MLLSRNKVEGLSTCPLRAASWLCFHQEVEGRVTARVARGCPRTYTHGAGLTCLPVDTRAPSPMWLSHCPSFLLPAEQAERVQPSSNTCNTNLSVTAPQPPTPTYFLNVKRDVLNPGRQGWKPLKRQGAFPSSLRPVISGSRTVPIQTKPNSSKCLLCSECKKGQFWEGG